MTIPIGVKIVPYQHGATVYTVVVNNATGQFGNNNTTAFEAYSTSHYTAGNYGTALSELGTASGIYTGSFPSWISVTGSYTLMMFIQSGGSPAESDNICGIVDNFNPNDPGYSQIDWGNLANPSTSNILSATQIFTVNSTVGGVTGNVGGSVGSVVGNVGGSVVGSVGSISGVTFPGNFGSMIISAGGLIQLDPTEAIPTSNTPNTVGDCLNAARAQGFGVWKINLAAKTLTLFAPDGVTVVRTFNLDSVTAPTQRV